MVILVANVRGAQYALLLGFKPKVAWAAMATNSNTAMYIHTYIN